MDPTAHPIRLAAQLKQHLRALRQSRGLTQAQLGSLLGVKQARIAEIESNPGAVSVAQLIRVFAVLGSTLYLRVADSVDPVSVPVDEPAAAPAARQKPAAKLRTASLGRVQGKGQGNVSTPTKPGATAKRRAKGAAHAPQRAAWVSRPKKGTW